MEKNMEGKKFNSNKKTSSRWMQVTSVIVVFLMCTVSIGVGTTYISDTSIDTDTSVTVDTVISNSGNLDLQEDGGVGIRVEDSSGDVGIHLTNPLCAFHSVADDGQVLSSSLDSNDKYAALFENDGYCRVGIVAASAGYLRFGTDSAVSNFTLSYDKNTDKVRFYHDGGYRMYIEQDVVTINDALELNPVADAPSSPSEGMLYYDSGMHKLRVRTNTAWVNVTVT